MTMDIPELHDSERKPHTHRSLPKSKDPVWATVHDSYLSEQELSDRLAGVASWLDNFLPIYGDLTGIEEATIIAARRFLDEGNAVDAERRILFFLWYLDPEERKRGVETQRQKKLRGYL